MNVLSILLNAPLAVIAAPLLALSWLARPGEQRLQLENDRYEFSRVVLAQASDVG